MRITAGNTELRWSTNGCNEERPSIEEQFLVYRNYHRLLVKILHPDQWMRAYLESGGIVSQASRIDAARRFWRTYPLR